ncbi:hypothetical protein PG993_005288 [Apiospora rasikravindrae]|uniref:Uncharacterized protein n=1 Tax=Apiospora rasikravindrae TaxID=990691 RepID=A0ABR1TF57_9PEZI
MIRGLRTTNGSSEQIPTRRRLRKASESKKRLAPQPRYREAGMWATGNSGHNLVPSLGHGSA